MEICTKHRKFLLGTFYRPPNSPPGSMLSIETSMLSPYPCFISLLYLDLYVLGDDALIS